jgi:hypothetical protein
MKLPEGKWRAGDEGRWWCMGAAVGTRNSMGWEGMAALVAVGVRELLLRIGRRGVRGMAV